MSLITNSAKVTALVEELIKAANEHVETTNATLRKETVNVLKASNESSASIDKSLKDLKYSFASQTGTIAKSIAEFKDEVVKAVLQQTKVQTLQWAITNAELGAFSFFEKDHFGGSYSTTLVQKILMTFMSNCGLYVNDKSITSQRNGSWDNSESAEADFREALSNQIYKLTGQKPRFEKDSKGWAIFYS